MRKLIYFYICLNIPLGVYSIFKLILSGPQEYIMYDNNLCLKTSIIIGKKQENKNLKKKKEGKKKGKDCNTRLAESKSLLS